MRYLMIPAVALTLALPATAQEEATIAMEEVPQAAMDAANTANTIGCTFETVGLDDDEGTATYELAGTMANGMGCEIDVLEDGTVEEIEEQIEMTALPESVTAALEAEMAGFQPEYIEKSTRPAENNAVFYEFEGMHDGKEIDAELAEDGTGFMMNDDTAG